MSLNQMLSVLMKVSKEHVIEEIKDEESGELMERYEHDSYSFCFSDVTFKATVSISEKDTAYFAGLRIGEEIRFFDNNWASSSQFKEAVSHLKQHGVDRYNVLFEHGYESFPKGKSFAEKVRKWLKR